MEDRLDALPRRLYDIVTAFERQSGEECGQSPKARRYRKRDAALYLILASQNGKGEHGRRFCAYGPETSTFSLLFERVGEAPWPGDSLWRVSILNSIVKKHTVSRLVRHRLLLLPLHDKAIEYPGAETVVSPLE